ncbi:hypothetical protein LUZ60_003571 [Juncus effusus]|nr:hypothetical protein LUZ60_003571 [Juncus effusus]
MNSSSLASILLSFWFICSRALTDLNFTRSDFPKDFVFGAGSSAYQIEGAVNEDGRTPSIWDTFTHEGWMVDKSTADVSCDGYHKYKEDVELMGEMGLEAYRFSISWSRLIPHGRGAVNPKGLEFYNNLINALVQKGIEIHITLHHVDLPQDLQDEYGGWLSPRIIEDFTAYADVIFKEFGDRVSHWTTMVEPNVIAISAYDAGEFPPMRCSKPFGFENCTAGNSTIEPYIVLHNMLLTHASVAELYRDKYKVVQQGVVGINVFTFWCHPFTNSLEDTIAAQRALDFVYGWVINPVVFGDYPSVMRERVGAHLPKFTKKQSELVTGSADFIGINHYTSAYISDNSNDQNEPTNGLRDINTDMSVLFRMSRDDPPTTAFRPSNLPPDPHGLQYTLEYFRDFYGNIPVYIEENGLAEPAGSSLNDSERIQFISNHIGHTLAAMRNGSNVKGYLVWAFMDVFELLWGYQNLYGLYHVDFEDDNRPRTPKMSAYWYSDFMKGKSGIEIKTGASSDKYHAQQ